MRTEKIERSRVACWSVICNHEAKAHAGSNPWPPGFLQRSGPDQNHPSFECSPDSGVADTCPHQADIQTASRKRAIKGILRADTSAAGRQRRYRHAEYL